MQVTYTKISLQNGFSLRNLCSKILSHLSVLTLVFQKYLLQQFPEEKRYIMVVRKIIASQAFPEK